ncbi:hemolymph lipopolysaccharide-binding protein-like [Cydia splendana]|uniref:hemolymph lipopolysaccharide-binding protein-like n=1 Tax=Cydia splendana TaxID=1100963 RepID=UPI0028F4AE82
METVLALSIMSLLSLAVASPRAPCGCKPVFEYCANDHATYHSICEYKCKHPSTPFQDWFILYYGPCVGTSEITTTDDESQRIAICGKNGYEREPQTGGCYKFHRVAKPWDAARATCRHEGADLAVINSDTESQALHRIYKNNQKDTIVGAYDTEVAMIGFKKSGNDWVTIHGDSLAAAGFDGWTAWEPNNLGGIEDCGSILRWSGRLNDCPCFKPYPFICEIP